MRRLIIVFFAGLISLTSNTISLMANPIQGPGSNYWALFCKTGANHAVDISTDTLHLRLKLVDQAKEKDHVFMIRDTDGVRDDGFRLGPIPRFDFR